MRNVRPTLVLAALTAMGALALATAAPGQPATATATATPPPSPSPAPDASAAGPDPALTLIQAKCTMCHDTGPILAEHHTASDWKDLVNEMVGRGGAVVSPDEADQIVAYLAKTQPAAPPAPAPAS